MKILSSLFKHSCRIETKINIIVYNVLYIILLCHLHVHNYIKCIKMFSVMFNLLRVPHLFNFKAEMVVYNTLEFGCKKRFH